MQADAGQTCNLICALQTAPLPPHPLNHPPVFAHCCMQSESLSKCELMLGMFVNRANAAWAEQQRGWCSAHASLALPGDLTAPEGSDEFKVGTALLLTTCL